MSGSKPAKDAADLVLAALLSALTGLLLLLAGVLRFFEN